MPLRDHFRPPVDDFTSWEGLHGQWPALIVHQLRSLLPAGYVAQPKVHLGTQIEVDLATFETSVSPPWAEKRDENDGGQATAVWSPPKPTLAIETQMPDYDEYEIRVFDTRHGRRMVAAIEIVSPANRDRPESRNAFVGKCAALLKNGVAVSIVDLVTVRHFNLYAELLDFLGQSDSALGDPLPDIYVATCRWVRREEKLILEVWSEVLAVGRTLPVLPLWLSGDLCMPLDLEPSYEQACHDLWIT